MSVHVIYFSSVSNNTHRFVQRLGLSREPQRIPLRPADGPMPEAEGPYVLILPTYGGEKGAHSVPPQVHRFLGKSEANREHLSGVISAGNTNFGTTYCIAGDKIAAKLDVPHLYRFEVFGTEADLAAVRALIGVENTTPASRPEA